jgi:hypothetical protein
MKVFLGETALRVRIAARFTNCPNFREDIPNHVRSRVRVEVFQIVVGVLEGTTPVLTTEKCRIFFSFATNLTLSAFSLKLRIVHFRSLGCGLRGTTARERRRGTKLTTRPDCWFPAEESYRFAESEVAAQRQQGESHAQFAQELGLLREDRAR